MFSGNPSSVLLATSSLDMSLKTPPKSRSPVNVGDFFPSNIISSKKTAGSLVSTTMIGSALDIHECITSEFTVLSSCT